MSDEYEDGPRKIIPPKTVYKKGEFRSRSQLFRGTDKPVAETKTEIRAKKKKRRRGALPMDEKVRKCIYIPPELALVAARELGGGNLSKAITECLIEALNRKAKKRNDNE